MTDSALPFGREDHVDKPGIVGARWWQRSLVSPADEISRRRAVQGILVASGVVAGLGVLFAVAGKSSSSDYRYESRTSLDMQKEYGWSFGANAEPLTFDGAAVLPFDRAALPHLADDLRPARAEHLPFYVPTLFQSPTAVPRSKAPEETTPAVPLDSALTPIFTPAMDAAYKKGRSLASLFKGISPAALVVVDLPGPEAVAFAAGASSALDPVFAFDNWPHPRGVVPAHQTLAAAAYYQPLFAKHLHDGAPKGMPALLVLDRQRLSAYAEEASQFDNRHTAKLPTAQALKQLGYKRVLYIAPTGVDLDLDDLNDDFVLYALAGLSVRLVGADAFGPDPKEVLAPSPSPHDEDHPAHYYGGSASSQRWFWHDYPWVTPPPDGAVPPVPPTAPLAGLAYVPTPRPTPFSSGGSPGPRPRPSGFGTVAVVVSAAGILLGARLLRSGSWNRSSGGWGG